MSAKDRLERVFASVPQGAVAARVTSAGETYEPDLSRSTRVLFENQPPLQKIPPQSLYSCGDLIGRTFGRMTVIGMAADKNPRKKARWVVRCVCGRFEHRKARAIRNPANDKDCCLECENLRHIKAQYERLGSRSVEELRNFKREGGQ